MAIQEPKKIISNGMLKLASQMSMTFGLIFSFALLFGMNVPDRWILIPIILFAYGIFLRIQVVETLPKNNGVIDGQIN